MFTRRFKKLFARFCIALLCMQAVVAAYACPAFLAELAPASVAEVDHAAHAAPMAGDCDQHTAGKSADKNMCHQHYAGDQSVGSASLASAAAAPTLPLAIVTVVQPVSATSGMVLPVLLQRITAPPVSIRFQVLRI